MRTVKINTYAQNNKPATIEIENFGTMSFQGFAQRLYQAGLIDYKRFIVAKKVVFDTLFCTKVVNENIDLFPIEF